MFTINGTSKDRRTVNYSDCNWEPTLENSRSIRKSEKSSDGCNESKFSFRHYNHVNFIFKHHHDSIESSWFFLNRHPSVQTQQQSLNWCHSGIFDTSSTRSHKSRLVFHVWLFLKQGNDFWSSKVFGAGLARN